MSSSQSLPTSNPQTNANTAPSPPSSITPALRLFATRLSESLRRALSQRRPWHELVDRTGFSRPDSLTEATSRVRKNLSYFRALQSADLFTKSHVPSCFQFLVSKLRMLSKPS
ncbi:hypothetical protein LguiB_004903 [Lonicera macranthoides]